MSPSLTQRDTSPDGAPGGRRTRTRGRALLGGGLVGGGLVLVLLIAAATWFFGTRPRQAPTPPRPSPPAQSPGPVAVGRSWTVTPSGERGDGSPARPLVGLQEGLDAAQPGDTVVVLPGTYATPVHTVRDGLPGRPIRVTARSGAQLRGESVTAARLFTITHSWIVVTGLDVGNGNKGFWLEGVRQVVLRGNHVHDIGGECLRIKYLSSVVEVVDNRIGPCGLTNFDLESNKKNGEGVYIGTSPDQLSRNPTDVPDRTNRVWVHDNVVRPRAECVEIKESALNNVVENNDCAGGSDPDGSGLSARGNDNVIRANVVRDFAGKGVRLGGGTADQGVGNQVYGNTVISTGDYAIGVKREPQRRICGNTLRDNASGPIDVDGVDPAARCP